MSTLIYPILGEEEHLPIYIVGMDSTDNLVNISKPNGYPYPLFVYCSNGKGLLEYSNHSIAFKKNEWIFIPSFTPCTFLVSLSPCKLTSIVFDGCDIINLLDSLKLTRPLIICTHNDSEPVQLLSQIKELLKENVYIDGYINSALIYSLAINLSIHNRHHTCKNEQNKVNTLFPIVQYIYNNFRKSITLEELSDIALLSPQYICKLFKEYFGARPFEYIAKIRIQYSKKLLVTTNKSINEISKQIGYKDSSYFCAVFKRQEKITPAEFRNNCKYILR